MMCKAKILIVVVIIVFVSKSLQLTVHCEYKNSSLISNGRKMWKIVTDPYSCVLENLEIISKLLVTNVTGSHVDEYTNDDVRALKIIGGKIIQAPNKNSDEIKSSCEIIPSGFGAVFSNIEALAVTLANLKTVSSADLKQFSSLREIWLETNQLEFLESTLFQFNPNIEVISFIGNKINYIGSDFFDFLPKLSEAWFNYNWCINEEAVVGDELNALKEKIKETCFISERRVSLDITVDCKYQISSDWEVVKDPYECNLLSLNITSKLVAVNATGRHLPGKWNNNVKAMTIYGGICHIIPSALGTIFSNIEALAVWNSSLKIVSSSDLQQFVNLREIWFLGNDLYLLESNLFRYNPRVEIVVVKSNKIKNVGGQFFDYLPNLRKTDFRDNECIDEAVTVTKKLSDFKDILKEKCDVSGEKFSISTTIRPDGLFYWTWINVTINNEDEGFGDAHTDAEVGWKVLASSIG